MRLTVHPVPAHGAEDVLVLPDGSVLTGTGDGSIWRLDAGTGCVRRVASTGGRPLGLELLPDGRVLVCDAHRGLLAVSLDTGRIVVMTSEAHGAPMKFCNNAAVQADGTVWFTDSSRRFRLEQWREELVQMTRTGRLLRRDVDGTVTTVLDGLAFANGVALAGDESFVCVAETASRTVVRLWLTGPRAGQQELLAADLPGYPDNISRGSDGNIWVSVASPRNLLVERLQQAPPGLRRAATRIPQRLQPQPRRTVRVQAYDDSGRLVEELDVGDGGYHMVTGVREHDGRVWLGSLHEAAIAVVDRP